MRLLVGIAILLTLFQIQENSGYMIRFRPGAITRALKTWLAAFKSMTEKKTILPMDPEHEIQIRKLVNIFKRSQEVTKFPQNADFKSI